VKIKVAHFRDGVIAIMVIWHRLNNGIAESCSSHEVHV